MSKRAETAAIKAYPKEEGKMYSTAFGTFEFDRNAAERKGFQEGYEQAEKDLELTWNDMQLIWQICDTINDTERRNTDLMCSSKAYFSEVLRMFNNARKEK